MALSAIKGTRVFCASESFKLAQCRFSRSNPHTSPQKNNVSTTKTGHTTTPATDLHRLRSGLVYRLAPAPCGNASGGRLLRLHLTCECNCPSELNEYEEVLLTSACEQRCACEPRGEGCALAANPRPPGTPASLCNTLQSISVVPCTMNKQFAKSLTLRGGTVSVV